MPFANLEHPYEIWCIEDLIEWSNNYNKYSKSNIKFGYIGDGAKINKISNCSNSGNINSEEGYIGGIVANIYKCFYDEDIATDLAKNSEQNGIDITCKSMNKDEMKSNEFIEELNKNEIEEIEIWKKDIKNINNGYPIFVWQHK